MHGEAAIPPFRSQRQIAGRWMCQSASQPVALVVSVLSGLSCVTSCLLRWACCPVNPPHTRALHFGRNEKSPNLCAGGGRRSQHERPRFVCFVRVLLSVLSDVVYPSACLFEKYFSASEFTCVLTVLQFKSWKRVRTECRVCGLHNWMDS